MSIFFHEAGQDMEGRSGQAVEDLSVCKGIFLIRQPARKKAIPYQMELLQKYFK
jgi:hypothetical protein